MSDGHELRVRETSVALAAALERLRLGGQGSAPVDAALAAMTQFEVLAGLVYRLRRSRNAQALAPVLAHAEDLLAATAQTVIGLEAPPAGKTGYAAWIESYRAVWYEERSLFFLTAVVFVGTTLVGVGLAQRHPELVPVILPQANMEAIIEKKAWFADLNSMPLLGGAEIAINNIRVSILAFVGSGLLGVGGLVSLGYNGILIGTMFGYCAANGFGHALGEFVLGHGPLELTIIVASTFAGLIFGRNFFQRPYRGFAARMSKSAAAAATVLSGVLPWLVIAGIVEAFVSPRPDVAIEIKMALGSILAAIFWIWTLKPQARAETLSEP